MNQINQINKTNKINQITIHALLPQCEIDRLALPFEQQEDRMILGKT